MARQSQETIQVVNNQVLDNDDEFSGGFYDGYLYHYDTNVQLPHPLTCQSIYAFMQENMANMRESKRWNAGFVFGWVAALSENNPDYFFTSIALPEQLPATEPLCHVTLQEV
jgi:hypothetical protein